MKPMLPPGTHKKTSPLPDEGSGLIQMMRNRAKAPFAALARPIAA
jgi:hypothetical protein